MKAFHTLALAAAIVTGITGHSRLASADVASEQATAEPNTSSAVRPTTIYKWVEPSPASASNKQSAISRILYLNNCLPNGCQMRPGRDDSRTNTSGIIDRAGTLTKWSASPQVWKNVMTCMRGTFAPFNIKIVDVDPGNVPHMEVFVAGRPADIGFPNYVGGVAPFSCGYIENSVSYAFANLYQGNVNEICATAAQEVAHTWALDHEIEASDPMTYNPYNGRRKFKDAAVRCGSDCQNGQGPMGQTCTGEERDCSCTDAPTQNSFQQIKAIFGSSNPMPPVVKITTPRRGDSVQDGTPVRITVTSEQDLSKAELRVDGTIATTLTTEPFVFNVPAGLAGGQHTLEVTVYDVFDLPGKASVDVTSAGPCTGPTDCADGQTCVNGACVAGPGSQGGLGETCEVNNDCVSGTCADGGPGMKFCVEGCAVGQAGQCPSGFDCLAAGNDGVCWPNGGNTEGDVTTGTCGSCASSSDPATLPLSIGLLLAGMLVSGRRRRRSN